MIRLRHPPLLLFLLFTLLVHFHPTPTSAQINCNSVSCAPDHSASCAACNASSTQCQTAWYAQPGFSCGTATARSASGTTQHAQCCPTRYGSSSFHCQAMSSQTVLNGSTYDVTDFSCVRDKSGLSAGVVVGVSVAAVATLIMMFVGCGYLRRRMAFARATMPSPLLEGEEGSYVPPMEHYQPPVQPVQPYSTTAYRLDAGPLPQHSSSQSSDNT